MLECPAGHCPDVIPMLFQQPPQIRMKCLVRHPTPNTTLNALNFLVTELLPLQLTHILPFRAHSLILVLRLAQRTSATSRSSKLVCWPHGQTLHMPLGMHYLHYIMTASSHTSRACRSWLWMPLCQANLPAWWTVAPMCVLQMIPISLLTLLKSTPPHRA
jgi:hypothetical protein